MTSPRYFVAVFGDPGDPPEKDPVESGTYVPDLKYQIPVRQGDVMLLYCTEAYPGFPRQVPGVGTMLRVNVDSIEISLDTICTANHKR